MTRTRGLALTAGVLLAVTAVYHGTGVGDIDAGLFAESANPIWPVALRGLWLFFSWHLLAMSVPAFMAAFSGAGWCRPLLLFCGVVTFGDFIAVFSVAGWFPGTVLLLAASLCLLASGALWKKRPAAEEGATG